MGKTNYTFVSPLRTILLMLVAFGFAGLNTAMAQCTAVPNITIDAVGTDFITFTVTSGDADPQHSFRVVLEQDLDGTPGFPLTDAFAFYDEMVGLAAGTYTFGTGGQGTGLPCNSRYKLHVREYCDNLAGNSGRHPRSPGFPFFGESHNGNDSAFGENPPAFGGIEIYTYSAMYENPIEDFITQSEAQLPSCPGGNDGCITIDLDADLFDVSCCENPAFNIFLQQDGTDLGSGVGVTHQILYAGVFTTWLIGDVMEFCGFNENDITITIEEISGCTLVDNPAVGVFDAGDGVDIIDPFYYVVDIQGILLASNDPDADINGPGPLVDDYTGDTYDFGTFVLPEGECGRQDFFFVWAYDNCATMMPPFDGILNDNGLEGLVTATTTTVPASVNPDTAADVIYDGVPGAAARVDVHWSGGASEVVINGCDLNGNCVDITLLANIEVAETDLSINVAGITNTLIPVCETTTDFNIAFTITGGCDVAQITALGWVVIDLNNGGISFPGAGFFGGTNVNEFFIVMTDVPASAYQLQIQYTTPLGNTALTAYNFTVEQAGQDYPAQIIATDESYTIPYCEDEASIFYTFTVTDDCQTIDDGQVSATINGDPVAVSAGASCDGGTQCASYQIAENLDPGVHTLVINYGAISVTHVLDVDQSVNQAPVVDLPGNLNVTIPPCVESIFTLWSIQISDDCDGVAIDPTNLAIAIIDLGGNVTDIDAGGIFINGGYIEFGYEVSAADDFSLLDVSYTDDDGATTNVDAVIRVHSTPDVIPPVVVYPSQDMNFVLDPCDIGGTAMVVFEASAIDNCSGNLTPIVSVSGGLNATVIASPGGDTYLVVAGPGSYNVTVAATDAAGNNTTEDFNINVTQAPAPVDNLGCNGNLNITLGDDCTAYATPDLLLEGNFGCLVDADFDIVIEDGNQSNGHVIDGCGVFDYTITLAQNVVNVSGFTNEFAEANWTRMTDIGIGDGASVTFTADELVLSVQDAGSFDDGDDLDLDGLNAVAAIAMPASGNLTFDYDYQTNDDTWDWYLISVDGNILASSDSDATDSFDEDVDAGSVLMFGLDDDGFQYTTFDATGTLTVSNFAFAGAAAAAANFTTCWGTLNVEDKEDPVIVCPDDLSSVNIGAQIVTSFAGNLSGAPTFQRPDDNADGTCNPSGGFPTNDDVPYQTQDFTVTAAGVYTFTASGDSDMYGFLATSDFDPTAPCDSWLVGNDDSAGGLDPEFDFEFTTVLPAGSYTIVTTQYSNTSSVEAYVWDVTTPLSGGDFLAEDVTIDLICDDIQVLRLDVPTSNIPDSYVVDKDGDVVSIDPALKAILDKTGYPTVSDNCGDVRVYVSDVYASGGNCGDDVITRSFHAADKENSPCVGAPNVSLVCTQTISSRKPTLDDVNLPLALVEIDCNDYAGTANPGPELTGFPAILTALDNTDVDGDGDRCETAIRNLDDAYCNLGASYVDLPRIVVCEGTYKFVREWTLLDWCFPTDIRTFRQVIKVGDYDGPEIEVPTADYDWDGNLDVLQYSTAPNSCVAWIPAPAAGVTDDCSGAGSMTVSVWHNGNQIWVGNVGQTAAGPTGLEPGDYTWEWCATDGCGNETCETAPFVVRDLIAPSAVCDDELNVSIGGGDIHNGIYGVAIVTAENMDEGSNDNCGEVRVEVRRNYWSNSQQTCSSNANAWSTWGPQVEFHCCDIDNTITIELRVWDDANGDGVIGGPGDLSNVCWLEVTPEDKLNPYCYPPHDHQLTCTELPLYFPTDLQEAYSSDFNETSTWMNAIFGEAWGTDNCAVDTIVERTPTINLSDCGWGTITRRFEAWQLEPAGDVNGNNTIDINEVRRSTNVCTQTITITELHDYYIEFPEDVAYDCSDPTIPGVNTNDYGCDVLAVNPGVPERFSATGDECYKLRITYTVINWCLWDGETVPYIVPRDTGNDTDVDCNENPIIHGRGTNAASVVASIDRSHSCNDEEESNNNTFADGGYYQYTQFVKVYDSTAPVITVGTYGGPTEVCPDLVEGQFGSIDNVNCTAPIEITFAVSDDCELFDGDGNLVVSVVDAHLDAFAFDANGDGEIKANEFVADATVTGSVADNGDGTFTFTYDAPIIYSTQGPDIVHALRVRIEDGCNNQSADIFEFDVVDCKAPTPICINGLTVTLMPQPDGGCAMAIWASDFLASPISDCSEPIRYAIYRASFVDAQGPNWAPSQDDTGLVLTLADENPTIVYIYAIDAEGNFGYCETYLLVQEHDTCIDDGGSLSGTIATQEDETVQDVEVNLSGGDVSSMTTLADGAYTFQGLETGMDYTVTPLLDAEPLNGVSTFDLVLMSKHILGVDALDTPYDMIAADVNNSQTITTLDLIQLRKLILNIYTEFSNNTSWRFIDASYVFPDPSNPWLEAFPEVINENDLQGDVTELDFVGVKIGDVNSSATANILSADDRTLNGAFNFNVSDVELKAGNVYTVEFTGADMVSVEGYQLTLALDGAELVDVVYATATEDNFGMRFADEGMITTSWNGEASSEDVLFSLVITASADAMLSEVLGVSSRYTAAEAYNTNGSTMSVGIEFGNTGNVVEAGFELYQNTPNPFKGETLIGFNLPQDVEATITINDVTGRVITVIRQDGAAGYNTATVTRAMLNGATGVMSYTVTAGDYTATKKMVVVE